MLNHRLRQALLAVMLGCVTALALVGFAPSPAQAVTSRIVITGTGGDGVNLRSGPGRQHGVVGKVPEGATPQYLCYTRGEHIGGPGNAGTNLWFKAEWYGAVGYYTSFYDDVPLWKQTVLERYYGINACDGSLDISQIPSGAVEVVSGWNGQLAANWAREHAQDKQPDYPSCTWFASQALWAGGLQKDEAWHSGFDFNDPSYASGTRAARLAKELHDYLLRTGKATQITLDLGRFQGHAIPEARVGDVIFYDWGHGEGISHAAVVTSIGDNSYPNVAEWGTASNPAPYRERGWSWSENSGTWLRDVHGNDIKAYLLRING